MDVPIVRLKYQIHVKQNMIPNSVRFRDRDNLILVDPNDIKGLQEASF